MQYGFKAVIAPKRENSPAFADIFKNNSTKNGLLLVELSETEVADMAATLTKNPKALLSIDLANQNISLEGKVFHFAFDSAVKQKFLEGLDDIGTSEKYADAIAQFEKTHSPQIY
ncbi:MAG: isopropylmalate isomerase small subunit [uncultured bacterium]|nr:MAG: isopropylmalate isomerase small subunit [uncultured bacterium]